MRFLFQNDLNGAQVETLSNRLCEILPVETLRKGYLAHEEMSFEWENGAATVATRLDAVLIGWGSQPKLEVGVASGAETLLLPCLSMHPVKGFCFPKEYAGRLKKEIIVKEALVQTAGRIHRFEMNLPARKVPTPNGKGSLCDVRYVTYRHLKSLRTSLTMHLYPTGRNDIMRESVYAWERHWGTIFFKALNADGRQNLFRIFTDEWVFVPGAQIWDDLCGTSGQRRASYKNYRLSFKDLPPLDRAETFGYYRTRYRDGVNGYILFMNLKQLMRLLGKWEDAPGLQFPGN